MNIKEGMSSILAPVPHYLRIPIHMTIGIRGYDSEAVSVRSIVLPMEVPHDHDYALHGIKKIANSD